MTWPATRADWVRELAEINATIADAIHRRAAE